ncbi:hypothetical protein [Rhodococcoides kyotonense]|uniref:Uncharacterized protein n=1 Tax=Rhodococcoides kyotonense TaxID=398843 RepID=A0A239MI55_9NOCA|nr:hypothetical protein [Rhodococcus kyotonensis]SNT42346.1 hypothetical protein SAMN05421642_11878 [Rhodococcus kyotonensis]
MGSNIDPIQTQSSQVSTALERAEIAALSELASPEAITAFALVRNRLRPAESNRFTELSAVVDRLAGPELVESAEAELNESLREAPRTESVDELVRSARGPIAKLAVAQLLRDDNSSGQSDGRR